MRYFSAAYQAQLSTPIYNMRDKCSAYVVPCMIYGVMCDIRTSTQIIIVPFVSFK